MAGIGLFILGSVFLFIPLYKVICEQTGLTVATHAKDYIFPESKGNQLNKLYILQISESSSKVQSQIHGLDIKRRGVTLGISALTGLCDCKSWINISRIL